MFPVPVDTDAFGLVIDQVKVGQLPMDCIGFTDEFDVQKHAFEFVA